MDEFLDLLTTPEFCFFIDDMAFEHERMVMQSYSDTRKVSND